jgi:hypothetical protein
MSERKYIFFDIEYANPHCCDYRMYSFRYVITDDKFNIIIKQDLLINPNVPHSQWDWGWVKKFGTPPIIQEKVKNGFNKEPKFPHYYSLLEKMLTDKNTRFLGGVF